MHKYKFLYISIAILLIFSSNVTADEGARGLFIKKSGSSFSNNFEKNKAKKTEKKLNNESDLKPNKKMGAPLSYIGLSAAVYQLDDKGRQKLVSFDKKFRTGDRIRVQVTSNKSGYLTVTAIDPKGGTSSISEQKIIADTPIFLPNKGSIKFDGQTGEEQIVFTLSLNPTPKKETIKPEDSLIPASNSCNDEKSEDRNLIVDNSRNDFFVLDKNGKCIDSKNKDRGLIVENYDDVDYGVMPTEQLEKGNILGLKLYLHHE